MAFLLLLGVGKMQDCEEEMHTCGCPETTGNMWTIGLLSSMTRSIGPGTFDTVNVVCRIARCVSIVGSCKNQTISQLLWTHYCKSWKNQVSRNRQTILTLNFHHPQAKGWTCYLHKKNPAFKHWTDEHT
jgi:hypothetical protein